MIIESMLDNDAYKFTMMQAIFHQHSKAVVEYMFKCRTPGIDFRPYIGKIIKNVNSMCRDLQFKKHDLEYLADLRYIKPDFTQLLKLFRFDRDYINISIINKHDLDIHIAGPWLYTEPFEVPVLSIVSEVYSRDMSGNYDYANDRTSTKAELIKDTDLRVAEFGGRRRHSVQAQYNALMILKKKCPKNLIGTSNVMFAKDLNLTAVGTMAHEWLQAHQSLGYRIEDSQSMALENWAKEYRGDLGIALSDVIGLEAFLHDFDMYFSKLFDGTRQDSGDPYTYADSLIEHYKSMNIDPMTKTIVFSDGLTFEKALALWKLYKNKIGVAFGIGTHITNDFGFKAPQIVLKMTKCNGQPVAKISDSPAKGMCTDQRYVEYMKKVFNERCKEKIANGT